MKYLCWVLGRLSIEDVVFFKVFSVFFIKCGRGLVFFLCCRVLRGGRSDWVILLVFIRVG